MRAATAALLPLMLLGCAMTPPAIYATIHVTSVPEGATISAGGITFGTAPFSIVQYHVPTLLDERGCMIATPITATWMSGAQATTSPDLAYCQWDGTYNVTLTRPADAPGLEADVELAAMTRQQQMQLELIEAKHRMELERQKQQQAAEQWPEAAETLGRGLRNILR